jgi:hypothetical protein
MRSFITLACRVPGVRSLWTRFPVGSLPLRVDYGIWRRPHYAYGIYRAAQLAGQFQSPGVTVIEFGVAGGNGLLTMAEHAAEIAEHLQIKIEVIGFDSGSGMPATTDPRDLPYAWRSGSFAMDEHALRSALGSTRLILGPVEQTVMEAELHYPVGFIAFDLDYYTSTLGAMRIFSRPPDTRLPRVFCYFDDILYPVGAMLTEHVGELAAIETFNRNNESMKLGKLSHLNWTRPLPAAWCEQMYALHDFEHPLYSKLVDVGILYRPPSYRHRPEARFLRKTK